MPDCESLFVLRKNLVFEKKCYLCKSNNIVYAFIRKITTLYVFSLYLYVHAV